MKKGYAKYVLFFGTFCVFVICFIIGVAFLLTRAKAPGPVPGLTDQFISVAMRFSLVAIIFFGILAVISLLYKKKHRYT